MRRLILMGLALLAPTALLAQQDAIPLRNWTVPPYTASSVSGIHTMTDVTDPRAFIGIAVCRLLDTRPPANNPLDGDGAYGADEIRTYTLTGFCGIPIGADAVSLNLTVTSTGNHAFGHLKVWPASQAEPNVSTLNWSTGGVTESNAAILALSTGQIKIKSGNAGSEVIVDVNGYFSDTLNNTGGSFVVRSNSVSGAIMGVNTSTGLGAVAVAGILGAANPCVACLTFGGGVLGVAGSDFQSGVTGVSTTGFAVDGFVTRGGSLHVAEGALGVPFEPFVNYGVYSYGDYGGTGAKYFVEPHPSDAARVIRYIALEGPEPGTYFRGRGRFERGVGRIAVPEDFRAVTDEEGLSVQITPIGAMASFAVFRADLTEIVVQSSRNVEFYYLVQGIRRTHKHLTSPIAESTEYMPRSAESTMPLYLTERQKLLLIGNGTYNANGTANLETARRLGWDKIWAERRDSNLEESRKPSARQD